MDAWGRRGLADPALRRIEPENLSIVLLFLGYRPESQVERIMAGVEEFFAGLPAPMVELGDPEPRPEDQPRLVLLPVNSPGVELFHIGLRTHLAHMGHYEVDPDRPPFWPHLTVARVRPVGAGSRRPMAIRAMPSGPLPRTVTDPCWPESVSLYHFELRPTGARHARLETVELRRR
ncbi:MAG TPA: 2'-5' RNA ligase family protein [Solirubrobacterales bacterium]